MFILPLPATIIEEIQLEQHLMDKEISEEISDMFDEHIFYERNLLQC